MIENNEKFNILLIQSEDDFKLNEIFFIKKPMTIIGSKDSCDIVLNLNDQIEPLHAKINADDINDLGIEDLSEKTGILKQRNGNKFYLKKKREYELLSDRHFYLNDKIKMTLLEGTYEELAKRMEMENIQGFEYYFKTFIHERYNNLPLEYKSEAEVEKKEDVKENQENEEKAKVEENVGKNNADLERKESNFENCKFCQQRIFEDIFPPLNIEGMGEANLNLNNDEQTGEKNEVPENVEQFSESHSKKSQQSPSSNVLEKPEPPMYDEEIPDFPQRIEDYSQFDNYGNQAEDINDDMDINAITIDKEIESMNNLEEINSQQNKALSTPPRFNEQENIKELENDLGKALDQRMAEVEVEGAKYEKDEATTKLIGYLLPDLAVKDDMPVLEEIIRNTEPEISSHAEEVGLDLLPLLEKEKSAKSRCSKSPRSVKSVKSVKSKSPEPPEPPEPPKSLKSLKSSKSPKSPISLSSVIVRKESVENIEIPQNVEEKKDDIESKEKSLSNLLDAALSQQEEEEKPKIDISDIIMHRLKDSGFIGDQEIQGPSLVTTPKKKCSKKDKMDFLKTKRKRGEKDEPEEEDKIKEEKAEPELGKRSERLKKEKEKPEEDEKTSTRGTKKLRGKGRETKKEEDKEKEKKSQSKETGKVSRRRKLKVEEPESSADDEEDSESLEEEAKIQTRRSKSNLASNIDTGKKEPKQKSKNAAASQKASKTSKKKPSNTLKVALVEYNEIDQKLEKNLNKINCEIVDEEEVDFDILLCNKLSKKPSVLLSINLRKPILSMKWLEDSISNKKVQPYDKYFLKDKEMEKKFNFSLHKTMTETPFASYLEKFVFYVTDHINPTKNDITEIIESAGGEVTNDYNKKYDKQGLQLIIIADMHNDKDLIKTLSKSKKPVYKIYDVNLILDSVFGQKLELNKSKYKI